MIGLRYLAMSVAAIVLTAAVASVQEVPADYKAVLSALGKTGDFKDGVLKVNIPRNDLRVTINQRSAPTPFGFGGWVALTKGQGMDVMMGDLVLTENGSGTFLTIKVKTTVTLLIDINLLGI